MNIPADPSQQQLLVLGHRGAISDHFGFQQNSLRAFEEAVAGGDGFETDACVDKDGEIFLIHEAKYVDPAKGVEYCAGEYMDTASASSLGSRRIDELTTGEMRTLGLKDGSPIPTLRQAIELIATHKKLINIELKAYEIVRPVLRLIQEYLRKCAVTPQSFILSSFNHPALEIVRREIPEMPIGALFNYQDVPETSIFPWRPGRDATYVPLGVAGLASAALRNARPDYVIMPQEIMTEQSFAMIAAHYPQAKCAGWIFTEKGNFSMQEFLVRFEKLRATRRLAAMIVDNPREFKKIFSGN